jgi:hypothetical protein
MKSDPSADGWGERKTGGVRVTASAPAPTMATEVKQMIDQCGAAWNETDPVNGQ